MMTREDIIGVGKEKGFMPEDYINVARGDRAVCIMEQSRPKALDDLITYFEGFARGMEEGTAAMADTTKKR